MLRIEDNRQQHANPEDYLELARDGAFCQGEYWDARMRSDVRISGLPVSDFKPAQSSDTGSQHKLVPPVKDASRLITSERFVLHPER